MVFDTLLNGALHLLLVLLLLHLLLGQQSGYHWIGFFSGPQVLKSVLLLVVHLATGEMLMVLLLDLHLHALVVLLGVLLGS